MKGLKKLLPIAMVFAMLSAMLVPGVASAGTDGAVSTTLSGNDTPDLVVAADVTMTPQSETTINVTVTDADDFADIASVVLKLYWDADTTAAIQSEFGELAVNAETVAGITWTSAGGFVLDEETDSTWAIGVTTECSTPAADDLSNPFIFVIKPSKVATEAANTGTACWQISALVTDDQSTTGYGSDASRVAMNWYGDITVNTANANFGILVPGTDFFTATVGSISMKYVSNSDYDEQVKVATDAFTGVTVDVVDPWACSGSNEIAFKADDDDTSAGAVGVTAGGATIDDLDDITEESGDTVTINSLWLKIGSTWTAYGEKTGNIYFVIANGEPPA